MNYEAIILAAGVGQRMQANKNKVFLTVNDRPILLHTLDVFVQDQNCKHIVLVGRSDENEVLKALVPYTKKKLSIVSGGKERQDSVYEGLRAIQNEDRAVFVHDGARPFVTLKELLVLAEQLQKVSCALLGVPAKDTIKLVQGGLVEKTVPRENLWQAQTPQVFHGKLLKQAHEQAKKANYYGTDDVSLVEKFFPEVPIQMVEGSYENIKVTTPEDLYISQAILAKREMDRLDII